MGSIIKVDTIKTQDGTKTLFENGEKTFYNPGEIIEMFNVPCDGRSVTLQSGTYTVENVTAALITTSAWVDLTGSSIAYVPPAQAKTVIYRFSYMAEWDTTAHSIQHFKFFIDSDEVLYSRYTQGSTYYEGRDTFEWTISIGDQNDTNTGSLLTWDSLKTLKMQTRRYVTASYGQNFHQTHYFDGGGSDTFSIPSLSIIALG